jgi:hypothetical protein
MINGLKTITILFGLYCFLFLLLMVVSGGNTLLGSLNGTLPEFKLILLWTVCLWITCSVVSVLGNRFIPLWRLSKEDLVGCFVISLYISLYFEKNYVGFPLIGGAIILLLLFPNALDFFSGSYKVRLSNPLAGVPSIGESLAMPFNRYISVMGVTVSILLLLIMLAGTFSWYQFDKSLRHAHEMEYTHPRVASVEPTLVAPYDLVLVRGSGFGERVNTLYRVHGQDGSDQQVLEWDEHHIVFRVGSTVEPGAFVVARESYIEGHYRILESNQFSLDFYLPGKMTPQQQDRWFQQTRNLSEEYRQLSLQFPLTQ